MREERRTPFLLRPAGKDYLWGGERLKTDYGKRFELTPLAETWECSTHPDGESVAASGVFAGKTLREILRMHPAYVGTHPRMTDDGGLPILVKLIDAAKDLSVQVHPDDDYARMHENGSLGKSEMWYVLDAAPDARLIYGFHHDVSKEALKQSLHDGTVEKYLQKIAVRRGDVFFVRAGTVHAIGAGVLVAEIQESSNLTYRLYDYGRKDKDGRPRKLHIEKALEVARLTASEPPRQEMRVLRYQPGYASELLCRCPYFQVERLLIHTAASNGRGGLDAGDSAHNADAKEKGSACGTGAEEKGSARATDAAGQSAAGIAWKTDAVSFQVLLCIEGGGRMTAEAGQDAALPFQKGDCIFVPADSVPLRLTGRAALLRIRC